jgi:hypothetical protein
MWNYRWISFLFLLTVFAPLSCLAQSTFERLEEFASRSLVFDVPSVVHFEITSIRDGEKSGLRLRKMMGRFIQGERLAFRIDLQEMGDTDSGREWEREHFLSMPNGERFLAFERPSVGFNSVVVDTTIEKRVSVSVSRGNPFRYILNGCQSLRKEPEVDVFDAIRRNFEEFGHESLIRHKAGPAVYRLEFDKEMPWQINRHQAFIPQYTAQFSSMRKSKTKVQTLEETKNWLCARDCSCSMERCQGFRSCPVLGSFGR